MAALVREVTVRTLISWDPLQLLVWDYYSMGIEHYGFPWEEGGLIL